MVSVLKLPRVPARPSDLRLLDEVFGGGQVRLPCQAVWEVPGALAWRCVRCGGGEDSARFLVVSRAKGIRSAEAGDVHRWCLACCGAVLQRSVGFSEEAVLEWVRRGLDGYPIALSAHRNGDVSLSVGLWPEKVA